MKGEEETMFARHITAKIKPGFMDEALRIYEHSVVPESVEQEGYRGIYVLSDREKNKIISISLWDSAEEAAANEANGYYQRQVDKFEDFIEEELVKEGYDINLMFSKTK